MVRSRFGNWCGYAGVPPGHPWYQSDYNDVDVSVHGGLTYAEFCDETGGPICHVAKPGEPARVWWLGFDCGHAMDYAPGLAAITRKALEASKDSGARLLLDSRRYEPYDHESAILAGPFEMRDVYRTATYVRAEVDGLAKQIIEAGKC